jgi:hypothetical protein
MAARFFRFLFYAYALLAAFCLIYAPVVMFGLFGVPQNMEAAAPVLFVGMPWTMASLFLISGKEPFIVIYVLLGVIPFALNATLLWIVQRWLARRGW